VLEIGGRRGDSAMAWSSYLGGENKREEENKNVSVDVITYGGNNDKYKFNNPTLKCVTNCSVHTFYVDQSDAEKLEDVIGQRPGGWDIVIDDGSHVPFHNIISFETLWKNVRPGGIYIVEDIETSYYPDSDVYGYPFKAGILAPPPHNSLSRFRQYVDVINRGYIGPTGKSYSLFEGDHSIMEIGFARNLIFIRKVPEGKDFSGKTYSDYPDGMVKGRNFAQIEATLDIARIQFQNQTTLLGPSFNAKKSSNSNAESGMTINYNAAILDKSIYSMIKSKTNPKFSFAVYKKVDIVSNHAKKHGAWEGGLSNVMLAILSLKNGTHQIVDFGTHIGWFSLLAASRGHKSIGIEAMKTNRDAFINSIKINNFHDLIELHDKALGNYNATKELCIRSRASNNYGNGHVSSAGGECAEKVQVTTLDQIVNNRKIMFLKADCEGCEGGALLGAKKLLSTNPPCSMFIEWRTTSMRDRGTSDEDISDLIALLINTGYSFFRMEGDLVTGKYLKVETLSEEDFRDICIKGEANFIMMLKSDQCFQQEHINKFLELADELYHKFNGRRIISL